MTQPFTPMKFSTFWEGGVGERKFQCIDSPVLVDIADDALREAERVNLLYQGVRSGGKSILQEYMLKMRERDIGPEFLVGFNMRLEPSGVVTCELVYQTTRIVLKPIHSMGGATYYNEVPERSERKEIRYNMTETQIELVQLQIWENLYAKKQL